MCRDDWPEHDRPLDMVYNKLPLGGGGCAQATPHDVPAKAGASTGGWAWRVKRGHDGGACPDATCRPLQGLQSRSWRPLQGILQSRSSRLMSSPCRAPHAASPDCEPAGSAAAGPAAGEPTRPAAGEPTRPAAGEPGRSASSPSRPSGARAGAVCAASSAARSCCWRACSAAGALEGAACARGGCAGAAWAASSCAPSGGQGSRPLSRARAPRPCAARACRTRAP